MRPASGMLSGVGVRVLFSRRHALSARDGKARIGAKDGSAARVVYHGKAQDTEIRAEQIAVCDGSKLLLLENVGDDRYPNLKVRECQDKTEIQEQVIWAAIPLVAFSILRRQPEAASRVRTFTNAVRTAS